MSMLAPTQVTAPVAGTTAGAWKFSSPVRSVCILNLTGVAAYLRFDGSAASVANGGFIVYIGNNESVTLASKDITGGDGNERLQNISAWIPATGTVGSLYISGNT